MSKLFKLTGSNRNLLILHLTVVVWGFTGILGALISIPSFHLVWYRVLIAFITLGIYFKLSKTDIKVSRNTFLKLFLRVPSLVRTGFYFFNPLNQPLFL